MKIAVLAPQHSMPLVEQVLQKNGLAAQFQFLVYDSFPEILDRFESVRHQVQGVLVTGQLPWNYILAQYPDCTLPVTYIEHSRLRPCLYLIRHLIQHPDIPLSQTFCDFIHEIRDYAIYADILPPGEMPHTMSIASASEHFVEEVAQKVLGLYEEGTVKMAYLTITHLYVRLRALGVPCQLIGIQPDAVLQAARKALAKAEGRGESPNTVAAVLLEYGGEQDDSDELEYREATLMKVLVDYKRGMGRPGAVTIARGVRAMEVFLTAPEAERYAAALPLLRRLEEEGVAPQAVGIGLASDPRTARSRAEQALGHAREFGAGCAFGWDQDKLTGPLMGADCLTLDGALLALARDTAKRLNISAMNYVRLLMLFHRIEEAITSDRVAEFLHITVRSANRILAALLSDGVVEELAPDKAGGRGRPTRRYALANRVYPG